MADRAERSVSTEYVFDRAGDQFLAQVYRILGPRKAGACQ